MNRRRALKTLLGTAAGAWGAFRLPLAHAGDYTGKLFVFVQADGGWDPTSFCDPKTNVPGEPVINHWAERDTTQEAGGIRYAPFADNAAFFRKYHRRMLVINGVDAQTNSHTVGVTHNWSGRNAQGFPTMTALLAAHHSPDMPLNYLNFGGFSATGGLTRFTRLSDAGRIRALAYTNRVHGNEEVLRPEEWTTLQQYRARRIARLNEAPGLLPRQARNRLHYQSALSPASTQGLKRYAAALPPDDQLEQDVQYAYDGDNFHNGLRRQAQLSVLAFKTGVAVSADLFLSGFDTHRSNDAKQGWLLGALTGSVDYLWEYAELHGIADRLVVVIGSDFGRTNHYNAEDGKDHWPIGSFVIMEKNQPWTGRTVGETDDLHFAQKINPATLERDDTQGTIIYPKHVHEALRRHLGLADSPLATAFPFHNTEDFRFFG